MSRFCSENEDLLDEWQEERMFEDMHAAARAARTLPAPPASKFPKYCGLCMWPTTCAEWAVNPTRRRGDGVEHVECPNKCGNTLSIQVTP